MTPAPARVYDSRVGFPPESVEKGGLQTNEQRIIDLSLGGALELTGSYAVLVNLTVVNTNGAGFIALFAADVTWPGNSNINWFGSGQVLANNATTTTDASFNIKALNGGPTTDLVIDVMGAYLA